jgi:hypothetical protein
VCTSSVLDPTRYKILSEIELYQQTAYQFPVVEPVKTFLTELPSITEKVLVRFFCKEKKKRKRNTRRLTLAQELYELSLLREPRTPTGK